MAGDRVEVNQESNGRQQQNGLNLLDLTRSATRASAEPVTGPSLPAKPGEPVTPPGTPSKPGEPVTPPGTPSKPGEPVTPPGTPTKPGEPVTPPTKPGEPVKPPTPPCDRPSSTRPISPPAYLDLPPFEPRHHKTPKPEQPKPEQPKPEQPKPEQPKPEQPKPEQPKPEQPKPEQPKPEQPKPEQPKPEQPKPELPKPIEPKPIPIIPTDIPKPEPTPIHIPTPRPHTPPTGIWTGKGHDPANAQEVYQKLYSSGKYVSAHHEHLVAPSIGLKVDVDKVGTGESAGMKMHKTEMVPPKERHHLGEWKYDIEGKTVIAGHIRYNGEPGPMHELRKLGVHNGKPDVVTLEDANGHKTQYEFAGRTILKDQHDQAAWNKVFAPNKSDKKELVLVTCAGPVDSSGSHPWRLIVNLREVKEAHAAVAKPEESRSSTVTRTADIPKAVAAENRAGSIAGGADVRVERAPTQDRVSAPELINKPVETQKPAATVAEKPVEAAKPIVATEKAAEPIKQTVVSEKPAEPVKQNAAAADLNNNGSQPQERRGDLQVSGTASPGSPFGTRVMYTEHLQRGSMTGVTGEVAFTGDKLAYGQVGPNFNFLQKNDKYSLTGNLRAGFGTGETFKSANIPLQGMKGLTLSGQMVGTDYVGENTRLYAGGGFGLSPMSQTRYQVFGEVGAQQRLSDNLSMRLGIQGSQVEHQAFGTYAVGGLYYTHKATTIGLTVDQPLKGSNKPTTFLTASFHF